MIRAVQIAGSTSGAAVLEVIDKGSSNSRFAPLLFVHGAWHGAWCWDDHFLDFFADKGFRALALSLRGHGNSPTDKRLAFCSIADYVDDVRSVAETLPIPPVVIGHSMGGFVVQKYLESNSAPAGVLLASLPAKGANKSLMRFTKRYPWLSLKGLVTGNTAVSLSTPALAREYFFAPTTPEELVTGCRDRTQQESQRAIYLDCMFLDLPKTERVATPLLVIGAEHDGFFTSRRDPFHRNGLRHRGRNLCRNGPQHDARTRLARRRRTDRRVARNAHTAAKLIVAVAASSLSSPRWMSTCTTTERLPVRRILATARAGPTLIGRR